MGRHAPDTTARAPVQRVLLVDDDEAIQRDYGRLLRRHGFDVRVATSGEEALAQLAAVDFDVVLSDIAMGTCGGLELLRGNRGQNEDVPVVLVTGGPTLATALDAVEQGAFHYLVKPVDGTTLVETLGRAARKHRECRTACQLVRTRDAARAELEALADRFDAALDTLFTANEPVVRSSERRVVGYQMHARSAEPTLDRASLLFAAARRLDRVHELGRALRARVAADIKNGPGDVLFFVKVKAEELNDLELFSEASPLSASAGRIVLEISGREGLPHVSGLGTRLARLRARGFGLALDEFGVGHAGLASLSTIEPELVKLDAALVRGVHGSVRRRTLVRGLARLLAVDLGVQVVAEGVDAVTDRDALVRDGIELMQGPLFGTPEVGFPVAAS